MKLHLPLMNPVFDSPQLKSFTKEFDNACRIHIWAAADEWIEDETAHIYGLWVEYGKNHDKTMMFEVALDDLELFASALQKSIEMIRRDYKEVIQEKIKNGHLI